MDDINVPDLSDQKMVDEKTLHHEAEAISIQPEHRHVRFSSKTQDARICHGDSQTGEKEKGRSSKQKARENP